VKTLFRTFCVLLLCAGLAACGSDGIGPKRDINDPTNSLVFAYIDMTGAPSKKIYEASLKPQGEEGYWHMTVSEDGRLLSQPVLPPGSYQISRLAGPNHLYNFPLYGRNETAVRIQQPGIYFLGAYRYVRLKSGQFDVERVSSPSELELLQRLQKEDWVKGTQWEARLRNRIAELRGQR